MSKITIHSSLTENKLQISAVIVIDYHQKNSFRAIIRLVNGHSELAGRRVKQFIIAGQSDFSVKDSCEFIGSRLNYAPLETVVHFFFLVLIY